jgi:hypothetical protein
VAFDNSSATRRVAFEEETLEEWAIEISMAILREARQSRLKMCQIPPLLSPHSIFCVDQAARRRMRRQIALKFRRPYIWRLMGLGLLICPSA